MIPTSQIPLFYGVVLQVTVEFAGVMYTLRILVPQLALTAIGFCTFWISPECGKRPGFRVKKSGFRVLHILNIARLVR
jgi:hypothetical protein